MARGGGGGDAILNSTLSCPELISVLIVGPPLFLSYPSTLHHLYLDHHTQLGSVGTAQGASRGLTDAEI